MCTGGSSIQDLRLRLNTVLRSTGSGAATATAPSSTSASKPASVLSHTLAPAPAAAPVTTADGVQSLKERLARIKQSANISSS
jgi:hypothetical protein